MAKKEKNGEEKAGGKFLSVLIVFLIILVWLAAMVVLIKLDVGNFGSQVLRPVLKDVPVVNKILPAASDDEAAEESDLPYKTLQEALDRIEELEAQSSADQATIASLQEQVSEKDSEISRLQVFETDQEEFEKTKEEFYNEVVYGTNAPDTEEYTKWYESIDSEAAEEIYRQVVAQDAADEEISNLAVAYADMKPDAAASILETMSADLDTVVKIMGEMSPSDQAEILAAMDPDFAANVTKKLMP